MNGDEIYFDTSGTTSPDIIVSQSLTGDVHGLFIQHENIRLHSEFRMRMTSLTSAIYLLIRSEARHEMIARIDTFTELNPPPLLLLTIVPARNF
jgi:hypothetical protein